MGILKEFWFYFAILGIVYVAWMGWHSRFVTRRGKLRSRNNARQRENVCIGITAGVFIAICVETFWRISHGRHSVVFEIFTEEIFYELLLYSIFFVVTYAVLLFAVDLVAEILHIGIFQLRKEAEQQRQAEEAAAWEQRKAAEKQAMQRAILLGIARSNSHN